MTTTPISAFIWFFSVCLWADYYGFTFIADMALNLHLILSIIGGCKAKNNATTRLTTQHYLVLFRW